MPPLGWHFNKLIAEILKFDGNSYPCPIFLNYKNDTRNQESVQNQIEQLLKQSLSGICSCIHPF